MDKLARSLSRSVLTRRRLMATALAMGLAPRVAHAQTFPSHTIRVLVGFSAGSPSDLLA